MSNRGKSGAKLPNRVACFSENAIGSEPDEFIQHDERSVKAIDDDLTNLIEIPEEAKVEIDHGRDEILESIKKIKTEKPKPKKGKIIPKNKPWT